MVKWIIAASILAVYLAVILIWGKELHRTWEWVPVLSAVPVSGLVAILVVWGFEDQDRQRR